MGSPGTLLFLGAVCGLAAGGPVHVVHVRQAATPIQCNTESRNMDGDTYTVTCPSGCASNGKTVWGTDVYTDDSSICRAAIHAGRISDSGGDVTVYKLPGEGSYAGTTQNGVQTAPYGAWGGSFAFSSGQPEEQAPAADPGLEYIDCNTQSRQMDGDSFTVMCPADCASAGSNVWGSAIYTDDSSICRAAINDGRIPTNGGEVTVYKLPGQDSYQDSDQHGVATFPYGAWSGSFAFSQNPSDEAQEPAAEPAAYPADCNTQSRNVDGESFTASCPAGCAAIGATVWGSAVYTDDSGLCRAAIHDGRITDAGGEVTVYKQPGQDAYAASDQNGILTVAYGTWGGSFAFTADIPQQAPAEPTPAPGPPMVDCNTEPRQLDGESTTVQCPDGCLESGSTVWGYVIYTDDSSLCRAAIHDGRIPAEGGEVTVYKLPGQESYLATEQHGITTREYGSWGGSFAFSSDPVVPEVEERAAAVDCNTQSRDMDGDSYTVVCPAGCETGATVWGLVIYTDDSSICRAAIHDGRITNSGGEITVYKIPGQDSYLSSEQNGVQTLTYSSWGGSFAFTPDPAVPQQDEPQEEPAQGSIDCSTEPRQLDGDVLTVTCPAGCLAGAETVWGTVIYTDDSSICRAAIHDGKLTDSGGELTVYKLPGQDSYLGTQQNGIITAGYGSWGGSFAFTSEPVVPQEPIEEPVVPEAPSQDTVTCHTQSRDMDGDSFTANCPSGCTAIGGTVWGKAIYTDDSSICRAAIHDGRIPASGGEVEVFKHPGQESYEGSDQNDIQTLGYGSWSGSFAFTADIPQQAPPEPTPAPGPPTVDCNTEPRQLDGDSVTVECPDGCLETGGVVWGFVIYTDDSSLCRAAIHDGRIPANGGEVTVYKLPGQESYLATEQHGIATREYGSWGGSFAFSTNPVVPEVEERADIVDCNTQSRDRDGDSYTVVCPAGCDSGATVWGAVIYTDDSSICRAAIHDGQITNSGGEITVYKIPGQDSYLGSEQNGIQTLQYSSWGGSFAFSPDPVMPQQGEGEQEEPVQGAIDCHTEPRQLDGDSLTVTCPAGCLAGASTVWGLVIYTDDSSICGAAIHAGRLTDNGGEVTLYKLPGQESYLGSEQNGMQTNPYGSWGGSFAFTPEPIIPEQEPAQETVTCHTQSRDMTGESYTVNCPAGCAEMGGTVWGKVIYTDDSSICRAAIHDGQISAAGGEVTGYKLPGQESYQGSDQNGIQTLVYGSWGGSFAFTADPVIPPEEQPEPQEPGATPSADCNTESRQLDGDVVTVTCPDGCKQTGGSVWGTVVYTDDSSICRAAIHDGRIEETGGDVTIYKLPGRDAYLSSEKNGITTTAYGSWGGSFAFSENPVIPEVQPSEDTVTCSTEARDMQGESFTIVCPADCASTGSTVWGDGIYTDDSSICRAAIHAGMIGDSGGEVTVYMLDGQDSYEGSESNGVSSLHYGSWGGSFGFTSGNEEGGQEGEGSEGSEFTCSVSCENGGVCVAQDKCECPVGFTGDHCESESRAGPNDGRQGNTWTLSNMTCMCYFDYSRSDCGCCVPGGCQCTNEHPNLCVQCGYGHLCGVLDDEVAIDGWTLSETGCACPWGEPGNTDCACCRNRGCLCDQAHPNRCTQCGRPYDCGLTGIGWP
ncbi:uncharacterized protein [Branchiostoma lanceolatum]|uniref:uncharacterized protein isoform X2 n=1 Tax=Branchiostoma lanceolatum TaxID=7740 RepID=UPI003453A351